MMKCGGGRWLLLIADGPPETRGTGRPEGRPSQSAPKGRRLSVPFGVEDAAGRRRLSPLGWRGVILGALFRALGEIEARRLDVLVLFFEGRSVLSLVFALGGRTNAGGERRCGRSVFLECEVVRRRRGRRRSFTCNMDTPWRVEDAAPYPRSSGMGLPVLSSKELAIFMGRPMGVMYSLVQSIPMAL